MWQILHPQEQSFSATTFKYVVKKTKRKDALKSNGDSNSMNCESSIEQQQQTSAFLATPRKASLLADDAEYTNEEGSTVMPQSPKGVDEFDMANSFSMEPFEDFFAYENNPFRVATKISSTETSPAEGGCNTHKQRNEVEECFDARLMPPACIEQCDIPALVKKTKAPEVIGQASPVQDTHTPNRQKSQDTDMIAPKICIHLVEIVTPKMRLYIDDYDPTFFSTLLENLMGQSCIVKLDLHFGTNRKRSSSEMLLLFEMIQSLDHLETLHLSNLVARDLENLQRAFFAHQGLKRIRLCMMAGGIDATTLRSLCTIPHLTEISLETTQSLDVSPLLRSTTLRKLNLCGMCILSNAHIMAMVPILECNTVLHELDLEPQISFLAFKFLAHALRINRSIQVLQVNIESTASRSLENQVMKEIATVLILNSSLRELNNINHDRLQPSTDSCRRIMRSLETNLSIEHFHLFREDSSFANRKKDVLKPDFNAIKYGDFQDSKAADCSVDTTATTQILCSAFEALNFEPFVNQTRRIFASARSKRDMALHAFFGGGKPIPESASPSTPQMKTSL